MFSNTTGSISTNSYTSLIASEPLQSTDSRISELAHLFGNDDPCYKHYLKATQGATVRLNLESDQGIAGLCTDGLSACVCLVVVSKDKQRFSLSHTDLNVDAHALIQECRWVGDNFTLTLMLNAFYYNLQQPHLMDIFSHQFLPRIQAALKNANFELTIKIEYGYASLLAVALNPEGRITTPGITRIGQAAPYVVLRDAINVINACAQPERHLLDVQYHAGKWTALPKLSVAAREIIKLCKHVELINDDQNIPSLVNTIQAQLIDNEKHDGLTSVKKLHNNPDKLLYHLTGLAKHIITFLEFYNQITNLNRQGVASYKKKDYQNAIVIFETVLKLSLIIVGENHPDIISLYYNLGSAHKSVGDRNTARVLLLKGLDISKDVYGESHPETNKIRKRLQECEDFSLFHIDVKLPQHLCAYIRQGRVGRYQANNHPIQGVFTDRFYDCNILALQSSDKNKCSLIHADAAYANDVSVILNEIVWVGSGCQIQLIRRNNPQAIELCKSILRKVSQPISLVETQDIFGVAFIQGEIKFYRDTKDFPPLCKHPLDKKIHYIGDFNRYGYQLLESGDKIINPLVLATVIYDGIMWVQPALNDIHLTSESIARYNSLQALTQEEHQSFLKNVAVAYNLGIAAPGFYEQHAQIAQADVKRKIIAAEQNAVSNLKENMFNVISKYIDKISTSSQAFQSLIYLLTVISCEKVVDQDVKLILQALPISNPASVFTSEINELKRSILALLNQQAPTQASDPTVLPNRQ